MYPLFIVGQTAKPGLSSRKLDRYPKEFKQINSIEMTAAVDTFDSYGATYFLKSDSTCKWEQPGGEIISLDSGTWSMQPAGKLVIKTMVYHRNDTFDILKFYKHIYLVSSYSKNEFINHCRELKKMYRKNRMKIKNICARLNIKPGYAEFLYSDLRLSSFTYSKRNYNPPK
jgi:hypothetical protein